MNSQLRMRLDRFTEVLATLSGLLFTAVFVLTMINIVSRNLGGVAYRWIPGSIRLSFIWSVLVAAAVLYRRADHLTVDYVLSKVSERIATRMRTTIHLITLPFFALLIVNGLRITQVRMRISYETWDFPTGYAYLALPVCAAIMLVFNLEYLFGTQLYRTGETNDD